MQVITPGEYGRDGGFAHMYVGKEYQGAPVRFSRPGWKESSRAGTAV